MMVNLDGENWSLVGYDHNPVPGDRDQVWSLARQYNSLSENFSEMADALNNLDTKAGMQGEWVKKFEEKTEGLPDDFRRFSQGFHTVADQLGAWQWDIDEHQNNAKRALDNAASAQHQIDAYSSLKNSQQREYNSAVQSCDRLEDDATDLERSQADSRRAKAHDLLASYNNSLASAQNEIDEAKHAVQKEVADYQADGDARAKAIQGAQGEAPSVDSFAKIHYSDAWQAIISVVKFLSVVLAIASFFVGGWVILLATAVVGIVMALDKVVEGLLGDASWPEVAAEVVFAALSVFGSARCIQAGLKGFKGTTAFKSTKLGEACLNTLQNIRNSSSLKNFGILLQYSGYPKLSSLTGVAKALDKGKKLIGSSKIVITQVSKWKGGSSVFRTVFFYGKRTHLLEKTARASSIVKPFVMDQVKYGQQTMLRPNKAFEKITGVERLKKGLKYGGDAVDFTVSVVQSFGR